MSASSTPGPGTAAEPLVRLASVEVTDREIVARLVGGREVRVPIQWSWRLEKATPEQRARYELIAGGIGAHWPDIDEDLSAEGFLSGRPAKRPA